MYSKVLNFVIHDQECDSACTYRIKVSILTEVSACVYDIRNDTIYSRALIHTILRTLWIS